MVAHNKPRKAKALGERWKVASKLILQRAFCSLKWQIRLAVELTLISLERRGQRVHMTRIERSTDWIQSVAFGTIWPRGNVDFRCRTARAEKEQRIGKCHRGSRMEAAEAARSVARGCLACLVLLRPKLASMR